MRTVLLLCLLCSACSIALSPVPDPARTPIIAVDPLLSPLALPDMQAFADDKWCPSDVGTVRVVNPAPLVAKDAKAKALKRLTDKSQTFGYGDSCLSEADGWWHALGIDGETGNGRVLVQYWGPVQRQQYSSCPSGALFFLDFATFQQRCESTMLKTPQRELSEQQKREKETVQRLLQSAK